MIKKEQMKQEAYNEYLKEKGQVDQIVQRMIDEDTQMQQLIKMKQEQSK